MQTRKSLAIALAVSGLSGQAASADPGTWAGPYVGVSAGGGTGAQSQNGGLSLLPLPAGGDNRDEHSSDDHPSDEHLLFRWRIWNFRGAAGGRRRLQLAAGALRVRHQGDGSWSSISEGTCGYYSARHTPAAAGSTRSHVRVRLDTTSEM